MNRWGIVAPLGRTLKEGEKAEKGNEHRKRSEDWFEKKKERGYGDEKKTLRSRTNSVNSRTRTGGMQPKGGKVGNPNRNPCSYNIHESNCAEERARVERKKRGRHPSKKREGLSRKSNPRVYASREGGLKKDPRRSGG